MKDRMANKNILIVDDDRGLLKLLNANLSSSGFEVQICDSGEEGLKLANQNKPDLVILDVLMPRMKGREVCVKLKSNSDTKDIPVIFLTSKDSPDDIQAAKDMGAVALLTKPVNAQKLLAEVKTVLGLS